MARTAEITPVFYCSDPAVQAFVEKEAWSIGPYSVPQHTKTAQEVFTAARVQFGDMACYDLTIYHH